MTVVRSVLVAAVAALASACMPPQFGDLPTDKPVDHRPIDDIKPPPVHRPIDDIKEPAA